MAIRDVFFSLYHICMLYDFKGVSKVEFVLLGREKFPLSNVLLV